ncbi:MAG: LCP family protein [Clostridia bacterium]|nr:LCP family protein [Clostridia bacterium]
MKKKSILVVSALLLMTVLAMVLLVDDQVNVLLYGLEGTRSDTMMLVMMDAKANTVNVISIPRDTYYPVEGKNGLGQKKLNAVYGFKNIGGSEGLVQAVENITGAEIDRFVEVRYDAVKAIVDSMGGVVVDVPFDMNYDDPYAAPPLHIHLTAGVQKLKGDDAIGFLRFRKSNDGKIQGGDVNRIERQQAFVESASKKALSWRLPMVLKAAFSSVETDFGKGEALMMGLGMLGTSGEDIKVYTLPEARTGKGDDGLYYFFHDKEGTATLFNALNEKSGL